MAETIGQVQGQTPDSVEEWRVANSLTKYGWEFIYQYALLGGRNVKGGMIPDFLVMTVPKNTCLYIQGPYYHSSKEEQKDKYQQAIVFGMDFMVEVITTDLLETQQESDEQILEVFGRNN